MSTQLSGDLKSTAPTRVSRNAVNPFGAKDLTALAATLSPVGRGAREALIATAPYRQSEFHEDLAEYACAAPLATDDINAAIAAGQFNAPASALKAAELRSRTAPRGKPRTSEGCQNDLASVEGLTVALRQARDRSETASRARRPLLAGAHRDLREPLTAMLRLNSDWNVRGTDMVAVRMIEQQRQALEVMADLIDSFLTIAEPEIARAPALLTDLASRSAGRNCARRAQRSSRALRNGQPNGPLYPLWTAPVCPWRSGRRPARVASSYSMRTEGLWAHYGSICYARDIGCSRQLPQAKRSTEPGRRHRSLTSSSRI